MHFKYSHIHFTAEGTVAIWSIFQKFMDSVRILISFNERILINIFVLIKIAVITAVQRNFIFTPATRELLRQTKQCTNK